MRARIKISTLVGLVALSGAAPASDPVPDEAYGRSLEAALRRAQRGLEERTTLWEDHSTWETAWRVESPRYVVRTTRGHWFGRLLADSLESMWPRFQDLLAPGFEPSGKLPVYVFPDIPSYNAFGDANAAEHSSFYGSYYAQQDAARPVAASFTDNLVQMRMFVTHAATHQFLDRAFTTQPPTWVSEGLASYFELQWSYEWGVSEFERLRDAGRLLPLRLGA